MNSDRQRAELRTDVKGWGPTPKGPGRAKTAGRQSLYYTLEVSDESRPEA